MKTTDNRITYDKARESFFLAATIEGRSRATLDLYKFCLDAFADHHSPASLMMASPSDVRRYLLMLTERGYAKATIATHVKELRVFFTFCVAEDHIEKNPLDGIKAPKLPRAYPYVLDEEEVSRLLRAANGRTLTNKRDYAMIMFFLDTGVRVSELCGLTLDGINLATYNARVNGRRGKELSTSPKRPLRPSAAI